MAENQRHRRQRGARRGDFAEIVSEEIPCRVNIRQIDRALASQEISNYKPCTRMSRSKNKKEPGTS